MAKFNFYGDLPSAQQAFEDLERDEFVVFDAPLAGARALNDQIEALAGETIMMHHENTIPKWEGEPYFVFVPKGSDEYHDRRDKLRELAIDWFDRKNPTEVKSI